MQFLTFAVCTVSLWGLTGGIEDSTLIESSPMVPNLRDQDFLGVPNAHWNSTSSRCWPGAPNFCAKYGYCCPANKPDCCPNGQCIAEDRICCSKETGGSCPKTHPVCCDDGKYCTKTGYKCCPGQKIACRLFIFCATGRCTFGPVQPNCGFPFPDVCLPPLQCAIKISTKTCKIYKKCCERVEVKGKPTEVICGKYCCGAAETFCCKADKEPKCLESQYETPCGSTELDNHRPYPADVSESDVDRAIVWLSCGEGGLFTESYCPKVNDLTKDRSGQTIGVGVDLGQQTWKSLQDASVPLCVIRRVKPLFGHICKNEPCYDLRAHPNSAFKLSLTDAEAKALTKGLLTGYIKRIVVPVYKEKTMSEKAWDVLASIAWWRGALCYSTPCKPFEKTKTLCVKGTNYVCEALKKKNASDSDLIAALNITRNAYKVGTGTRGRLDKELKHLQGTMCGSLKKPFCPSC